MEKDARPTCLRPSSKASSRLANRCVEVIGSLMETSAAAVRTKTAPGTWALTRATRGKGSCVWPSTSIVIWRVYLKGGQMTRGGWNARHACEVGNLTALVDWATLSRLGGGGNFKQVPDGMLTTCRFRQSTDGVPKQQVRLGCCILYSCFFSFHRGIRYSRDKLIHCIGSG